MPEPELPPRPPEAPSRSPERALEGDQDAHVQELLKRAEQRKLWEKLQTPDTPAESLRAAVKEALSASIAPKYIPAVPADQRELLEKLYANLMKQRELLLSQLERVAPQREGIVPPALFEGVKEMLTEVQKSRTIYESLIDRYRPSERVESLNEAQFSQRVETLTHKAEDLRKGLGIPEAGARGWPGHLRAMFEKPKPPADAPERGAEDQQFLRVVHERLLQKQRHCLKLLEDFAVTVPAGKGQPSDPIVRCAVLAELAELYELQLRYEVLWQKSKKPSLLPAFLAIFMEELAEEGLEAALPFNERWTLQWMRELDRNTQRLLLRSYVRLRRQLMTAGVRNVPTLSQVLRGPAGKFTGDILKGLRPDSYFTVLLFAYYLHQSDNKTAAALQFASFLAQSGLSNAILGVCERTIVQRLGARHILARVPGHPVVKIAAALLLIYGEQELGIVDKSIKALEGWVEPAKWDSAGVILDTFSGSALLGQLGEIGYLMGFRGVDPEVEQMSFLAQRVLLMDYGEGVFWQNLAHDIAQWDEMVEKMKKVTTNPLRKRLWQTRSIMGGPGGQKSWVERQALDFYTRVAMLRHLQRILGELLVKDGIIKLPENFALDVHVTGGDDKFGDLPLRQFISSDEVQQKIKQHIEEHRKKDPKDQRVHLYDQCVALAREIANRRSVYVHLKAYNSSWVQRREQRSEDGKPVHLIPAIVEHGIISELAFRSQRLELLREAGQLGRRDYGRHLGVLINPERIEHEVPVLSEIFGKAVGPQTEVYRKAMSDAAEAATSYLPKEHDINVLFADLLHYAESGKKLTFTEVRNLRDHITDAIRTHAEGRVPYREAPAALCAALSLSDRTRVFCTEEIIDPVLSKEEREQIRKVKGVDPVHLWLKKVFKEDLQKDAEQGKSNDVVLLQFVIAEAKNGLATMTLTTFDCRNPDPAKWAVTIRRHHEGRMSGPPKVYDTLADRGRTDSIPFPQWVREHSQAAQQLHETLEEIRRKREEEYRREREPIERALKAAAASTDSFIEIPQYGEYRRKFGDAAVVLKTSDLPVKREFDHDRYCPKLPSERKYSFTLERKGESSKTYSIESVEFYSPEHHRELTGDEKYMLRDIVTTPIEGKDEESLIAVLNLAKADVRQKHYWIPSGFHNALGYGCEFYYEKLFNKLLPLYQQAKDKKYFLDRLFLELYWRKGDGITEGVASHLSAWFKNNLEYYFDGKMTAEDKRRCESGESLLPGVSDNQGIYAHKADPKATELYYLYVPGGGWHWAPPGKQCWMPTSETVVRNGRYKGKSPTAANLEFIRRLADATR